MRFGHGAPARASPVVAGRARSRLAAERPPRSLNWSTTCRTALKVICESRPHRLPLRPVFKSGISVRRRNFLRQARMHFLDPEVPEVRA